MSFNTGYYLRKVGPAQEALEDVMITDASMFDGIGWRRQPHMILKWC